MMRVFLVAAVVSIFGCTGTNSTLDLSGVVSGCRAPEACWSNTCSCLRATWLTECLLCDPRLQSGQSCDCTNLSTDGPVAPSTCSEPAQVCVGRAAMPCPGAGARCVQVGHSCNTDVGVPPDVVAVNSGNGDAGPNSEQRCAFADDVCCPGSATGAFDLGVRDANLDQSVSD